MVSVKDVDVDGLKNDVLGRCEFIAGTAPPIVEE